MKNAVSLEDLTQAGFVPASFSSLEGPSHIKQVKAREIPGIIRHLVGGAIVSDSDVVYAEAQVGGQVTMGIEVIGYHAEPVDIESKRGRALLAHFGIADPA